MDAIRKRRTIKLSPKHLTAGEQSSIFQRLSEKRGVDSVTVQDGVVHVEYDLQTVRLQDVEDLIAREGCDLSSSILDRAKRAVVHTLEQNEYDNLTQQPSPCCSNPRGIVEAKKKGH